MGYSCSASLTETPPSPRQPEIIVDDNELSSIFRSMTEELAKTFGNGQENTPLGIPLGTNAGQLRDSEYEAIGYISSDGQAKNITPVELSHMAIFWAPSNRGRLAESQGQRIPTLDLIVRNRCTNNMYIIQRVSAKVFWRDAVNAVLNRTLQRVDSVKRPK